MTNSIKSKIEELFLQLKREREIKNTSQALEFLSILILIKYLEIEVLEDYYSIELNNRTKVDFIKHYEYVIRNTGVDSGLFSSNNSFIDLLINSLRSYVLRTNDNNLLCYISKFLNDINNRVDFILLKESYEFLIKKMIMETSQSGEYYTPNVLSKIIVSYLNPNSNDSIYDPACGTSGLLSESINYVNSNNGKCNLSITGHDLSLFALIISSVHLILSGEKSFNLRLVDSLELSERKYYDIVLTNPPFGKSNKNNLNNHEQANYIDYQFLKHTMCSLKTHGKAAVILPERFLYDSSFQAKALKYDLFNNFNVECILSLPSGVMLPYTAVKILVVFFSRNSPSGNVWLYKLNRKEKISKNNNITISDFDDFFNKVECKKDTENSWCIDLNTLGDNYNILDNIEKEKQYGDITPLTDSLSDIKKGCEELQEIIHAINEQVEYIQSRISHSVKLYQFSKIKVGELVSSLKTVPLAKDKLLSKNEGNYAVYGGNGVIGYFNDYIHSGKFIVVGRVGALCGNVHYVEGDIWVTNNSIVFNCMDIERVYPPYLARVLANIDLRGLASGTAQAHLTVSTVKGIEVKLPSLEIQLELEEWLSQIDKKLKLQSKLLKRLDYRSKLFQKELNHHLLQTF